MDTAIGIHELIPGAKYFGSTNPNTEEVYKAIRWNDKRPKPTWEAVVAAWEKHVAEEQAQITASGAQVSAKQQAMVDNLPTWTQVSTAVDNITSLAEAKAFIKKLSRVVYWLAKDSET